jgi:hypothetical protein
MHRYFSTPPIFSVPVHSIDRDTGLIRGVTIAQVGMAKGHGGYIDKTFLLQIVENAATKPAGIKARFGHPNMCSSAMGTYLGRFNNYSYTGEQVKADLFLDQTSKTTPNGDLFSYVLDMAEKNPDMFGASIAFETSESEIIEEEEEGKKVKHEYFRLKELRATDIVDEPAATNGLFSADSFPAIATRFLDENPQVLEIIFSKPDSVIEFLSNYLNNTDMNISEKIKQNFAAFLNAFSIQPPEQPLQSTENNTEPDKTLNILFDALSASYPEFFPDASDFTQLQKAESITAFLQLQSSRLTDSVENFNRITAEHVELQATAAKSAQDLETANTRIAQLTEQLSARPSIPLNVTDPKVSLGMGDQEKDETGKQILEALPKDLKRQLKPTPAT